MDKKHMPSNPPKNTRKSNDTHYEMFEHPNMDTYIQSVKPQIIGESETTQESERGCLYFFNKFDYQILRPIFIYKWNVVKHKKEMNFDNILTEADNRNTEMAK